MDIPDIPEGEPSGADEELVEKLAEGHVEFLSQDVPPDQETPDTGVFEDEELDVELPWQDPSPDEKTPDVSEVEDDDLHGSEIEALLDSVERSKDQERQKTEAPLPAPVVEPRADIDESRRESRGDSSLGRIALQLLVVLLGTGGSVLLVWMLFR